MSAPTYNYQVHTLHQYLGKYVYIEYACHSTQGVIVDIGVDWLLTDAGSMLWTPCIRTITTTIPKPPVRKAGLPTNLGDLFL